MKQRLQMSTLILVSIILGGLIAITLPWEAKPVQAQEQRQISVVVDGDTYLYPPPIIMQGRILAAANLATNLGAQVNWDTDEKMAVITGEVTVIKLFANSRKALVNEHPVELEVPARIIDNRLMVPLRFMAETLGAKMVWDEETTTVEVVSKQTADVHRVYAPVLPARIAFTNNGHLWLLDGSEEGKPPVQVTREGTVSLIGWSPDGNWLAYLQNAERKSWAFSSESNYLWVVKADGSGAYQIDQSPVAAGRAPAWSPTDNTIAYLTASSEKQIFNWFNLKLADIKEKIAQPSVLIPEGRGVFDFAWSPDGRSLAVSFPASREQPMRIKRVTLSGESSNLLQLGQRIENYDKLIFPWGAQGLKWSPDGRYLAYYLRTNSGSTSADMVAIQLLDLHQPGRTVDLGTGLKYPEWLAWSPDSKQLAFIHGGNRFVNANKRLSIVSADDGRIKDCGSTGRVDTQPAWTANPPYRVAFCRGLENDWDHAQNSARNNKPFMPGQGIWIGDSQNQQPLTAPSAEVADYAPCFSPDGKNLVFLRLNRASGGSLYLLSANDGKPVELLRGLTGGAGYYGNYYPGWASIYWNQ